MNVYSVHTEGFPSRRVVSALGESLHSLYLCGSIATGTALPNELDADFTIVTIDSMTDSEIARVESEKIELLSEYPFVTKIDTPGCTHNQVLREPYDWGFWIRVVSHCIHGPDLSGRVPAIELPLDSARGLCEGTENAIQLKMDAFRASSDPSQREALCRKVSRSLIRGLVALTGVWTESWIDSISESHAVLAESFPRHRTLVNRLFARYHNATGDTSEVEQLVEEAMELIRDTHSRTAGETAE